MRVNSINRLKPDTHRQYSLILFSNELSVGGFKDLQPKGGHILIVRGVTMILFLEIPVDKKNGKIKGYFLGR